LRQRLPEAEIDRLLLPLGLSEENARQAFELIKNGLQAGINAAVMNGLPKQIIPRGECELYDAAFDEGYRAFKRQMLWTWLRWLIIPIVIAVAIGMIAFFA